MASTVYVDIGSDSVATLAAELLLAMAFLRRRLVSLDRQIVMGDLHLPVSGLGVELERLT